jgi:hypothetical protein
LARDRLMDLEIFDAAIRFLLGVGRRPHVEKG